MRAALAVVMLADAGVFFFGGIQHAGISLGRFHEPYILPAAIVEGICGAALVWGAAAILTHLRHWWRTALIGNLVALSGVLLGKVALAAGWGPRTASNDLYHNIMLVLVLAGLVILVFARARFHCHGDCAHARENCHSCELYEPDRDNASTEENLRTTHQSRYIA
jgi:hypothetical protein